ncbi:MAG TPA: hypothetical protein PL070_10310 [Flavobacteriales bacterium]|nr:hypothetical protein [Flavobacteriales bacterium]
MKSQYRITPEGQPLPTDAEIARYRDPKRLIYNYTKAVQRPKRPLYKDPKAFIFLLLIVMLASLISEERRRPHQAPSGSQGSPVPTDTR